MQNREESRARLCNGGWNRIKQLTMRPRGNLNACPIGEDFLSDSHPFLATLTT
jgi:hypothetical protein